MAALAKALARKLFPTQVGPSTGRSPLPAAVSQSAIGLRARQSLAISIFRQNASIGASMAEQDEIDALWDAIPQVAGGLLQEFEAATAGVVREVNSPSISVGLLSSGGIYIYGDPDHGTVGPTDTGGNYWLRIDVSAGSYFTALTRAAGGRRVLQRFAGHSINLVSNLQFANTLWTISEDPATNDLRITTGDPPDNALTVTQWAVITDTFGSPWKWTGEPPPPAPPPSAEDITVEVFWWGFHFRIPESRMAYWVAGGLSVGGVLGAVAGTTGPAAPFLSLVAAYVVAEFETAKQVDVGNGVFISMTWFAPGIFVPTAI